MIKDDQTSPVTPLNSHTDQPGISDADYEQMYQLLYAYRFGSISFLDLLDKLEEILHIDAPHAKRQTESD